MSKFNYGFWLVAVVAVQISFLWASSDSQLGKCFCSWEYWRKITNQAGKTLMDKDQNRVRMPPKMILRWRRTMDFLVNACFRNFAVIIIPILLGRAGREPMDFV